MQMTQRDILPDIAHYRIRVHGHLADHWLAWFSGLTITREEAGTSLIDGLLVDQAALHGVLRRVCDLGLILITVERLDDVRASISEATPIK
jgi:hypothetical protein